MKKGKLVMWSLILVLVVCAFGLVGCGGNNESTESESSSGAEQAAEEPKSPKIAVLMPSLSGRVYVSLVYGILDEAEKMGLEQPMVLAAGGYDKLDVQVKQVEDMMAAGVDAIIIMPLSEEGMTPALDRAVDAGIKVIEMGNQTTSQKVHARIRTDQVEVGKKLGEACVKALNGKGNVVMFNGPTGASWSQLETDGFKGVITNHPDIKILAEKWTVYDAGVAMNTMNDLLQAFPNIDYIYTAYDTYAEGAASALETAGLKGKIKMGTVSLTPATLDMLKDGTLDYVVGTGTVAEGRMVLQTTLDVINGKEVPTMQYATLVDYFAEDVKDPNLDTSADFFPDGWTVPK